jgi:hypothetical protein
VNLNIILQKLKSKKYGPGKNMIKLDVLVQDIKKIFKICEKYYSYDPTSLRISRTLEQYFEQELKTVNARSSSKREKMRSSRKSYSSDNGSSDYEISNRKKKDKKKKKEKKKEKTEGNESEDSDFEVKQKLFDNIMQNLDIEQKKGIIPIVQD